MKFTYLLALTTAHVSALKLDNVIEQYGMTPSPKEYTLLSSNGPEGVVGRVDLPENAEWKKHNHSLI